MRPRKPGILAALITVTLALPAQGLPSPCVQLEATLENPTMTIVGADWVAELHTVCYRTPDDHPPTYRGVGSDAEQWRPLVEAYWPAHLADRAVCVISWESGGNPDAKNPRSSARGLFQIMASIWAPHFGVTYTDLYDPGINTALAYQIYQIQGWGAWQAVDRGMC